MEALDRLRPMRAELTRVREQTESLADLLPALQRLEKDLGTRLEVLAPVDERLATIERTIDELAGAVGAIHETLVGVKDDIQRTTGLRGDRGVMERARDVFTGGNQEQDRVGSQGSASEPGAEPPT